VIYHLWVSIVSHRNSRKTGRLEEMKLFQTQDFIMRELEEETLKVSDGYILVGPGFILFSVQRKKFILPKNDTTASSTKEESERNLSIEFTIILKPLDYFRGFFFMRCF